MSDTYDWQYYRHDSMSGGRPPVFYRIWRGAAEGFHLKYRIWMEADYNRLSRYIENGEAFFDKTTREDFAKTFDLPLPDKARNSG